MRAVPRLLLLVAVLFCIPVPPAHAQDLAQAQDLGVTIHQLIAAASRQLGGRAGSSSASPAADEGSPLPVTLDDAVRRALERNPDIVVQRLNPQLQDIAVASALSAFAPTLSTTMSQSGQTQGSTTDVLGFSPGIHTGQILYNGEFSNPMRWGGEFAVVLQNRRQTSTSNSVTYNPQFTSTWSLQYQQPLLGGLRIDPARHTLAVSRINRDIADIQLRATIVNTVSSVRRAYWELVFATDVLEVARQSLELASALVQDNRERVAAGLMPPIDLVQTLAQEATSRQGVVTADNNRSVAALALKRLLVSGTDDPYWTANLEPVDRPEFRDEPVDVAAALRRALTDRTDAATVARNLDRNEVSLRFLRDSALPRVDLNMSYGVQGVGGTRLIRESNGALGSQVIGTAPGGFGDALSTIFRQDNPSWAVGLTVNYTIGTSQQDTSLARSLVQLRQVRTQLQQVQLHVATEVTNAAIALRNAVAAVTVARAARELHEQRLQAEQSKFAAGLSTNFVVVQAQRDLTDARMSELRAILTHRNAQVEFDRVQQSTLQSAGITLF
jgi:outer membrane protein